MPRFIDDDDDDTLISHLASREEGTIGLHLKDQSRSAPSTLEHQSNQIIQAAVLTVFKFLPDRPNYLFYFSLSTLASV